MWQGIKWQGYNDGMWTEGGEWKLLNEVWYFSQATGSTKQGQLGPNKPKLQFFSHKNVKTLLKTLQRTYLMGILEESPCKRMFSEFGEKEEASPLNLTYLFFKVNVHFANWTASTPIVNQPHCVHDTGGILL